MWFDQYADPIAFGRLEAGAGTAFPFSLTWQDQRYRVDGGGTIWSMATNGMDRQVGRMEPFIAPQRQ